MNGRSEKTEKTGKFLNSRSEKKKKAGQFQDKSPEKDVQRGSDAGGIKLPEEPSSEKMIWRAGNMLYPLPVVMVSCARPGEKPNIITAAWAGTVCTNPPMVSVSVRPERYSHALIEESGEFVINLVTEKLVRVCDWCGVRSGRDLDKFSQCNLTAVPAEKLACAPLIAQSPVNIECRVVQKLELGSHDLFLGEVVCVHADPAYLDENGKFELNRTGLVTYSHGEYFALGRKLGSFGYSVKRDVKGNGTKKKV